MEAGTLLKVGIALSVLGVAFTLADSATDDPDASSGLRLVAGLGQLLGLTLLLLAVYALAAPARTPPFVLVGALLFVLGRLAAILLGATLRGPAFGDPAVQFTFALLTTVSTLGTILLLVGVFQAVRARVAEPGPGPPGAARPARPPAKPSAIRPARAPLPPAKPGAPR